MDTEPERQAVPCVRLGVGEAALQERRAAPVRRVQPQQERLARSADLLVELGEPPVERRAVAQLRVRVDLRGQGVETRGRAQRRHGEQLLGRRAPGLQVVRAEQRDQPAPQHEGQHRRVVQLVREQARFLGEPPRAVLGARDQVQACGELRQQSRAQRRLFRRQ